MADTRVRVAGRGQYIDEAATVWASRAYRFNWILSRTMAIVMGMVMLVGGTSRAIGIDWRDIYR
ncbi:hypothetical protein KZ829_38975 [Actinoplanes hulinensis]|uniref:Uncharacterized protein n=1 Tax=Actinoplanes hulinensis TaxID=1144547 RepID=A0ABS7BFU7_9ACTN|nr:hypothetical protein [Actinoplanes hulinensis]MBW6439730.1 hypothetical protein [Actinoplanes hulinensis]